MMTLIYNAITKETTFEESPDMEEIPMPEPQPTIEERVDTVEVKTVSLEQTMDILFGGAL